MPGLVSALKEAGLGALVFETVNASSLTAWIREFDDNKKKPKKIEQIREAIEAHVIANLDDRGVPTIGSVGAAKRAAAAISITEQFRLGMTKS